MKIYRKSFFYLVLFVVVLISCSKNELQPRNYETENVIVIVMDGARYSETWGDPSHQYIPKIANYITPLGIVNTRFYHNGETFTVPGHTALATGFYENINNGGTELPENPSIFQYWRSTYHTPQNKSWVIASKGKIEVIGNCSKENWQGQFTPMTDCGVDGLGASSGYRHDSLTYNKTIEILSNDHPNLAIINFREPDYSGHMNDWQAYVQGIQEVDDYIYRIIQFIENDSIYQGTTTVFITNDHGRHLDEIADGFCSHGDDCQGCKHINLFCYGPDFKTNTIVSQDRELIDIPATIAELLHFEIHNSNGQIMTELFK